MSDSEDFDDDLELDAVSEDEGEDFGGSEEDEAPKPAAKKARTTKSKDVSTGEKSTTKKKSADGPAKKKASSKKSASADSTIAKPSVVDQLTKSSSGKKKKENVQDRYKMLDQIEHVLTRPDMYIGSVVPTTSKMWVYDNIQGMVFKKIDYIPGLLKIFDEILVNAADNKQRSSEMETLKVEIDQEKGFISVYNDGEGIPVQMHSEHNLWIPEMIFGHLLTGSNFDDDEEKVVGGRNGLGAKLANIYSTEFKIECVDSNSGKKYTQVFHKNLGVIDKPSIVSSKSRSSTKVSFTPDLKRFGLDSLSNDMVALMTKRVYDIAGCLPSLKVSLNGNRISIKSFQKYCELYLKDPSKPRIFEQAGPRWQVCISTSDGEFQQISFVNSICTTRGGTHVKHASDKIVKAIIEAVKKKNKGAPITPAHVRNHLFIFVNSMIVNPSFDSQPKETLTTSPKDFGSKCTLSDGFISRVLKCGVVQQILDFASMRSDLVLKKQSSGKKRQRLVGIEKLDDANEAGGKNGDKCTLILTEGDSAKTLAVSGLSIVGRDHYGVFPLRGKLLNVREAAFKQISENAEITHIKQILGLTHGVSYTSTKNLRYGHLMIMTDQDTDGSHIKGLLINFIHHFWPSLLQIPGFLTEFITPIVKAKAKRGKEEMTFFNLPEYAEWKKKEEENGTINQWKIKYYKGLGTSTSEEAKSYFSKIEQHQIDFSWEDAEDGDSIDMAFSKKRVEDRKEWMRKFKPGTYFDHVNDELTYKHFVNKELILFSIEDCARSIPSMVDGLKPGQRKILYCAFKRNLKQEIKVAQLAGYVAEHSAYHHGEASLQDFVGAHNINLLYPAGQFGSRLQGGKDAASPRYTFTRLNDITRSLFHPDDDHVLDYLNDDGQPIEPKYYIPIIPTVLINGAEGIGTGWSTSLPNYNPLDIVKNIKLLMKGEEPELMHPWYRGFQGKIEPTEGKGKNGYKVTGVWSFPEDDVVEVTELPIGHWTQNYKEMLEGYIAGTKKAPIVKDYKEYHTDTTVHFRIEFLPGKLKELLKDDKFEKTMKLSTTISISNIHLFDAEGRIAKYDTVSDILKDFYNLRLVTYEKRKAYLVDSLTSEWSKLDNKVRFILAVVNGEIIVNKRKKKDLLKELKEKNFTPFDNKKPKKSKAKEIEVPVDEEAEEEEEDPEVKSEKSSGYDYLLSMPLWNLTLEKVEKLKKERDAKEEELKILIDTSVTTLWEKDLDNFIESLEKWYKQLDAIAAEASRVKRVKGVTKLKKRKAPAKKKKVESDEEEEDFLVSKPKPAPKAAPAKTTAKTVPKKEEKSEGVTKKRTATGERKIDSFFTKKSKETEEISSDSEEEAKPKKSTKKRVVEDSDDSETEAKPQKTSKKQIVVDSDSEEEVKEKPKKEVKKKASAPSIASASSTAVPTEGLSLAERIALRYAKTSQDRQTLENLTSPKKTPSVVDLSDDEEEEQEVKKPAPKRAAAKPKAEKPKKQSSMMELSDSEEEEKPAPKKKAAAKPKTEKVKKETAPKKSTKAVVLSSDEETTPVKKKTGGKKTAYISSEEEEEEEEEADFMDEESEEEAVESESE